MEDVPFIAPLRKFKEHSLSKRITDRKMKIWTDQPFKTRVGKLRPASTFYAACEDFKQIIKKLLISFLSLAKLLVIAFRGH